jgi:hypothetical protein
MTRGAFFCGVGCVDFSCLQVCSLVLLFSSSFCEFLFLRILDGKVFHVSK